jgi:hypothetical protein
LKEKGIDSQKIINNLFNEIHIQEKSPIGTW